MKLSQLLMGIEYKGGFIDKEISDVVCDSRKIIKDCIFVCIKGENFDGHSFARNAIEQGTACVVVEKDMGIVDQIIVKNSRLCYGDMCAAIFANPASRLKLVGVTGTNGKTTVTTLVKHILTQLGKKVGLIGTIQNEIADEVYPTEKTTPDAYDLQEMFAKMVQKECEYAVMEVSSHALDQHRIGSAQFASSAFTNLTQDHLDYHLTMDNYFDAKCKLFATSDKNTINIDDEYGEKLADQLESAITFSIKDKSATLYAKNIQNTPNGVNFELCYNDQAYKIEFSTAGIFSVYNV
ncbi:MAG: UDP-N-acetylmuramoyl-L-alanyl-D-glutamate--2,6-diaminopimelate ligase, partial [Oscillospiraceae bacterium]|nr:UDP-N-acetylmuramoyl-L-alanyl-D-glutamate--2,6-diaminopimelate ligase [Oscillospiraceae bacterium]